MSNTSSTPSVMKRLFTEKLPYAKHRKAYARAHAALEHFFLSHEMQWDSRFEGEEFPYDSYEFETTPLQRFRYNDYRGWREGGARYEAHMKRQYDHWKRHRTVSNLQGKLENGSALWYHQGVKWMQKHDLE